MVVAPPTYRCLVSYLRRVIDANVWLSTRLDRRINPDHGDIHRAFLAAVQDEMVGLPEGSVVPTSAAVVAAYERPVRKSRCTPLATYLMVYADRCVLI